MFKEVLSHYERMYWINDMMNAEEDILTADAVYVKAYYVKRTEHGLEYILNFALILWASFSVEA